MAELFDTAMRRIATPGMDVVDLLTSVAALHQATAPARNRQAIDLYKTWIAYNADHPSLHAITFNYAVELAEIGDLAGAANTLRETIRLAPGFAPPYINLGGILERLGLVGQAIEVWSRLANYDTPFSGEAIAFKTVAMKQMGRVLEAANADAAAEQILLRCLDLNADQPEVVQHLLALRQRQCEWPVIAGTERLPARRLLGGISPLSVAALTDDPMFHLATGWHYCRHTVGRPPKKRHVNGPGFSRRPRIGYVSSDLRDHAVGFAMTDVIETHDHEAFEIFTYDCGISSNDGTRARIRSATDHWIDLNALNDQQACEKIQQDGIDILVDLNGYTKDARTKVFAMRPAPVIVNWFGFPGTMGSPYHHYLIADEQVIPKDYELFYSEKILRLPCYQPNDRKRVVAPTLPSRLDAGLPEAAFVYCCLNGMQKITPLTFQRWMTILRQTPNSVLWLLTGTADANDRLRHNATQLGVAAERLIFAEKKTNPHHLARYKLADLFLDTFPYGAHTTASDSLWMGVPVLTLRGRSFASRVCASLLTAAGLPELICTTPDDYVARAVKLGNDRISLVPLRERLIATRNTCTLFDTPKLVAALEEHFLRMLKDLARGELPEPNLDNLDIYREVALDMDFENIELLDTEAYRAHYGERLAELDAAFPIRPDARWWPGRRRQPLKARECFHAELV